MKITKCYQRWIGFLLAIIATVVGLVELNTIRKSSELAAAQAVMNTYYPARNMIIHGALRNLHTEKDLILFNLQIQNYPQGSEISKAAKETMMEIEDLGNLTHKQALTDYGHIGESICKQYAQGFFGGVAQSFVNEIVVPDALQQNAQKIEPMINLDDCQ